MCETFLKCFRNMMAVTTSLDCPLSAKDFFNNITL